MCTVDRRTTDEDLKLPVLLLLVASRIFYWHSLCIVPIFFYQYRPINTPIVWYCCAQLISIWDSAYSINPHYYYFHKSCIRTCSQFEVSNTDFASQPSDPIHERNNTKNTTEYKYKYKHWYQHHRHQDQQQCKCAYVYLYVYVYNQQ